MKKSNKLLLAGFLTGILLITAIHVTLYAKYKNGNYTIYRAEDDLTVEPMQSFPNVLFVSVRNVSGAIVRFNDVAQVSKDDHESLEYVQKGDTLLITGITRNHVVFNVPHNAMLSAYNSSLYFTPGKKTAPHNPVLNLQKSQAYFSGEGKAFQLGQVKVVASDSSTVSFQDNIMVNNLEVQLSNSTVRYTDGDFGQMSIITDSLSRISLQAKHLVKAKINTTAQQGDAQR